MKLAYKRLNLPGVLRNEVEMSLFEYDQGRLIPAQFGHAVSPESQGEVLDSVRRQVLEVISRPLFPVTWNDITVPNLTVPGMPVDNTSATTPDSGLNSLASPRLTALDGSGQVVLVEVLEKLDSQTLIESLARLGAISNLGWNDLAAAYPGGVSAFRSGWTQFRDAMPPNLTAGPRLILVATEIDSNVRPALDALTPSGLEVHHVSVREMSNGSRFLDVQRVAASLFSHDTNLLAGRAARVPALTSSAAEDFSVSGGAGVSGLATPGANAEDSSGDIPSQQAAVESPGLAGQSQSTPNEQPTTEPSPQTFDQPTQPNQPSEPTPVDEPILQTGSISRHSIMEAAKSSPVSRLAADEDEEPIKSLFTTQQGAKPEDSSFSEVVFGSSKPEAPHHSHRAANPEDNAEIEQSATDGENDSDFIEIDGPLSHDEAGLQAIAQVTGEDTPLFGYTNFAGEDAEIQATLLESGVILLEGRVFSTAREAMEALGSLEATGDGWDFWHLGLIEGPTLAEACEEINAELRRENA